MSVAFLKRSSDSAGNFSTDWETKLLCSSSSASPSPLQVPTNETDSRIFKAENLRQKGLNFSVGQERTDLVGKQPKTEQWEITSELKTSNNYHIRCIIERLRSVLSGSEE